MHVCMHISMPKTIHFRRLRAGIYVQVQGIIRRVQEDGPDRNNVDLDILPRSVRYRLRDVMDDVRPLGALHKIASCLSCCSSVSRPHDAVKQRIGYVE